MSQRSKNTISNNLHGDEIDFEFNNENDSSESTLPTDPTIPGLAGLSLFDVSIYNVCFSFALTNFVFF